MMEFQYLSLIMKMLLPFSTLSRKSGLLPAKDPGRIQTQGPGPGWVMVPWGEGGRGGSWCHREVANSTFAFILESPAVLPLSGSQGTGRVGDGKTFLEKPPRSRQRSTVSTTRATGILKAILRQCHQFPSLAQDLQKKDGLGPADMYVAEELQWQTRT